MNTFSKSEGNKNNFLIIVALWNFISLKFGLLVLHVSNVGERKTRSIVFAITLYSRFLFLCMIFVLDADGYNF